MFQHISIKTCELGKDERLHESVAKWSAQVRSELQCNREVWLGGYIADVSAYTAEQATPAAFVSALNSAWRGEGFAYESSRFSQQKFSITLKGKSCQLTIRGYVQGSSFRCSACAKKLPPRPSQCAVS